MGRGCLFEGGGCLFAILAGRVGAYLGEGAYWSMGTYSRKYMYHN